MIIMKRIFFLFFSLFALSLHAALQEEAVSLNTPTGTIYGRLILPDDKASFSVVALLIAGSGPTDGKYKEQFFEIPGRRLG